MWIVIDKIGDEVRYLGPFDDEADAQLYAKGGQAERDEAGAKGTFVAVEVEAS
jgi:hypothetical protein